MHNNTDRIHLIIDTCYFKGLNSKQQQIRVIVTILDCIINQTISRQDISQLTWLTSIMLYIKSSSLVMTIILASTATLVISSASHHNHHHKISQTSESSLDAKTRSQKQYSKQPFRLSDLKNEKVQLKGHTSLPFEYKSSLIYKGKNLMPLLSAHSALNQLKLSSLKPIAKHLYKQTAEFFNEQYQPILSQNYNILNHRRTSNLIDRLQVLASSLPIADSLSRSSVISSSGSIKSSLDKKKNSSPNSDSKLVKHRKEGVAVKIPKKDQDVELESKDSTLITNNEISDDNKVTGNDVEHSNKKKRHKDGDVDKEKSTKKDVGEVTERTSVLEDEIINKPNHHKKKIDPASEDSESNSNSSYSLTLANERSLALKTSKAAEAKNKLNNRSVAKAAAIALAPSLESIALRIVSSAASKTIGRSSAHLSSSHSSGQIGQSSSTGGGGDSPPQSLLSSFGSTILNTAISQLNSSIAPTILSSSTWPGKLSPLLYSLASLSGFNPEESSNLPPASSSFLSTDLSTSSSSSQPTLYSTSSVGKPHTSKQYSPTVLGIVNLARYVLCKCLVDYKPFINALIRLDSTLAAR